MSDIIWGFSGAPAKKENVIKCVGPGWHNLVSTLIDDLFALGWNGTLFQVKEKFGGLRFYIGNGSDSMFNRIAQAEKESYSICEECGKPGQLRVDGWMLTLCEEHGEGRPTEHSNF